MLFDTHCHLNFEIFDNQEEAVLNRALGAGVDFCLVPGSNLITSKKAIILAKKHQTLFAAVGVHPHHAQEKIDFNELEDLVQNSQCSAVGEIGLDYHQYQETKHKQYQLDQHFKEDQKNLFVRQIELAKKYRKPIIFHNREAKEDILIIIKKHWNKKLEYKTVFHCCEPDEEVLAFAQKYNIFIGVDGDVTYWNKKALFIKKVPLEMLVLETDSPYLTPEPVKKEKSFPNEPKNLIFLAQFVAKLKNIPLSVLAPQTTANAKRLFNL